jgi:hypothetical protein
LAKNSTSKKAAFVEGAKSAVVVATKKENTALVTTAILLRGSGFLGGSG